MAYKKYSLIFTIECESLFIAESVKKDVQSIIKKMYRDIILKSNLIEKDDTTEWLNFINERTKKIN